MAFDAFVWQTFLTILLLTFGLFLLITGAFTAYFGSGKSRKIGAGLPVGGVVGGLLGGLLAGPWNSLGGVELGTVIIQSIGVILAALIGAAAAIGLFLLAIMKSWATAPRAASLGKPLFPAPSLPYTMAAEVLIVLGSKTDSDVGKKAGSILEEFGVGYEMVVASAHRTPDLLRDLIRNTPP